MPNLLTRASVVVCPSRHEGLMRGMIEAMSVGRPVVSFDICSAREMLEQSSPPAGVVVPHGDYAAMTDALLRFATDLRPEPRQARRGARWRIACSTPTRSSSATNKFTGS